MNCIRPVFLATLISTLGFGISLASNVIDQTLQIKNLTFLSVVFFGAASTLGWMWLVVKMTNKDEKQPCDVGK